MPKAARTPGIGATAGSIRPVGGRVQVRFGSFVLADTDEALLFAEQGQDNVIFVPRRHLPAEFLHDDGHAGPLRGGRPVRYWSFSVGGHIASNGTWSFEKPTGEFAKLAAYVTFDSSQVQIEVGDDGAAEDLQSRCCGTGPQGPYALPPDGDPAIKQD
jgi:uncharacterized protein (DUF427 family)